MSKTPDPFSNATQDKELLALGRKQAELLPQGIWIPVPTVDDRKFWESKLDTPFAQKMLNSAEQALATAPEPPSDELFMDFTRNGNRTRYEKALESFLDRYNGLSIALCLTFDLPKYFAHWQRYNEALCTMPTWVLPAHDPKLTNFHSTYREIDLVSSRIGAKVAVLRRILTPILTENDRRVMFDSVQKQVIGPYLEMARNKRPISAFNTTVSNWNAVCNANSMIAMLATEMPEQDRTDAAALLLTAIQNYYRGFTSDGYCTEGISYWRYGFGHYLKLAAVLLCATQGKLKLFDSPELRRVARFPERFMLSKGYYPSFADCSFNFQMPEEVMFLRDWMMNNPVPSPDEICGKILEQLILWGLPPSDSEKTTVQPPEKISEFPQTGIFLFRNPSPNGLRFVCKGGDNNELHNHNDVGAFSIAFPNQVPFIGDLGGSIYSRDTFGPNRYKNSLLNSYGHPVPMIDGILQTPGENTEAKVVSFKKNDSSAEVILDISKAYPDVSGVKRLERSFKYDFTGNGQVTISDCAEFDTPRTFETALTTFGEITHVSDNVLRAEYGSSKAEITVDTDNTPWLFKQEILENVNSYCKDSPKRYAVCLDGKYQSVKITLTVKPLTDQE